MQPTEPSQADVQAVAAAMGGQPAPQAPAPQPQQPQMQPPAPTPQPAPTQQPNDPFATVFASEPAAPPAAPAAPQPSQPTEPTPTPQPSIPPTEPSQPAPQPQPQQQPQAPGQQPAPDNSQDYQTFEEYMESITAGLPPTPEQPDPAKINPDDPNAIKGFFDDLVNTAVARATAQTTKAQALQQTENRLWNEAFIKYGSLRDNKKARDLVHNIRMGYFQRGKAITPTQAADILIESTGQGYRQGVADNQVHTTIENVQPTGGGSTTVPTTLDRESVLTSLHEGGEAALANYLDQQIQAGKL